MMDNSLWHLLQTSDSAFPVGGFAHSYGLEGLVQADQIKTPSDLEKFIRNTWLPMLSHVDFPLIRLCRIHAHDNEHLCRLDQLAWASRATSESRRAQLQMGRQRLKLVAELTGHARLLYLADEATRDRWMANWPVVWGVESACLDVATGQSIMAYTYQSIVGILAASTKLIRIGPTEIQHILKRNESSINSALLASEMITENEIGWFTPMLDITGACHENAYTRLFIS
jgi:urease accessory protein